MSIHPPSARRRGLPALVHLGRGSACGARGPASTALWRARRRARGDQRGGRARRASVPLLGPFSQLEGSPPGGPSTPELGLYWALSPRVAETATRRKRLQRSRRALFSELNPRRLLATTEHTNTDSQAVIPTPSACRVVSRIRIPSPPVHVRGSPRLCACPRSLSVAATTSRRQGSRSAGRVQLEQQRAQSCQLRLAQMRGREARLEGRFPDALTAADPGASPGGASRRGSASASRAPAHRCRGA